MSRRATALVVTADLGRAAAWSAWLRKAGHASVGCVGPGLTLGCPRVRGARCQLREMVRLTIVDLECDTNALCTRVPDDGRTVFVAAEDAGARQRVMGRAQEASHRRAW
jgi:hypothetical protein